MKKQASQDVKNIYYAKATLDENGDITLHEAPKKVFDTQTIKLSVSSSTDKHYTSDGPDVIENFEGGTLELGTYGIEEAVLADMEGHQVDSNGVTIKKATDEAPYVAIGYEIEKRNKKSKFTWFPQCKKKLGSEEYEVKGEKINPKGSTLAFEIIETTEGIWNYTVSEDDASAPVDLKDKWFTKVYDGTWA